VDALPPHIVKLRELLATGVIGEVRMLQAISASEPFRPAEPRVRPGARRWRAARCRQVYR